MSAAITPTVGRVVLYSPVPAEGQERDQLAAIVASVLSPDCVTLTVMHPNGSTFPATAVWHKDWVSALPDVGEPCPWWEWMPYQLGQAAKTEAVTADAIAAEVTRQLEAALDRLHVAAASEQAPG